MLCTASAAPPPACTLCHPRLDLPWLPSVCPSRLVAASRCFRHCGFNMTMGSNNNNNQQQQSTATSTNGKQQQLPATTTRTTTTKRTRNWHH